MVLPERRVDLFSENRIRTLKSFLFVLLCLPAASMLFDLLTGRLAEPVEELTHASGEWALRFLLLTLAVTPLRKFTGWNSLTRARRMLGLASFVYMVLHFGIYLVLDRFFFWPDIVADLAERPYIIAGFVSLILCLPLALTSSDTLVRRLGGLSWKRLHRLVYAAAIAAVLHFFWLVKTDLSRPAVYAAILALLLGWRVRDRGSNPHHRSKNTSTPVMGQG